MMKYRQFGKTDFEVSALGFGCMRLPVDKDGKAVKTDEAIAMIRYAIDNGVNYVDNAYGYHNGQSEVVLGKALRDGYRQKVKIATKLPLWNVEKADDFDKLLETQLTRLETDNIDFYLFHSIGKDSLEKVKNLKLLDKMETALSDGRIKNIGFSFHDGFEVFKNTVDSYDNWSLAMMQYNYMDRNNQAGEKGLKYAAEKGLALVIMESCMGGRLANLPQDAVNVLKGSDKKRDQVEWAYDWLWNYPEISVVLSGMSTMKQVEENIIYASQSQTGGMTPDDVSRLVKVEEIINAIPQIPCTLCKYCSCPQGVSIPACFAAMNEGLKYGINAALMIYNWWMKKEENADKCIACGECEEKCPQHIKISEEMPKVAKYIAENT